MITLLEKKGKDKRLIKNWRPISLINVDTKIASKALAKRLENILPDLTHYNQNAYVKGRSIFDAIRTIDDVLESQAAQAHASRKRGIYKLFMVLESGRDLRERPVLGYKRPLTI